jgi:hypothetical protein
MFSLATIATVATVSIIVVAIAVNLRVIRAVHVLPRLDAVSPDGSVWPAVSLIVAACNEADTIEQAARTLLAIDYPQLEIIVVNDRSTDNTGEIIGGLADEDPRLRAVHIGALPPGWLGKVYALHQATEIATGKYLVFTDADVHFAPEMLRRAVTLCERDDIGHLAVLPATRGGTLAADAAIASFAIGLFTAFDTKSVGREGSDEVVGVGAFGMIRREGFESTSGWPWLKMEILDDLGLAQMMVHQGGVSPCIVNGQGQLSLSWYEDLPAMVRGLEKNSFVGLCNSSLIRAGFMASVPFLLVAAVIAAAFLHGLAQVAGLLYLLSLVWLARAFRSTIGHPPLATVLSHFFLPVLSWAILRSTYKTLRQRGIYWRGTFYPLQALREGKRVRV